MKLHNVRATTFRHGHLVRPTPVRDLKPGDRVLRTKGGVSTIANVYTNAGDHTRVTAGGEKRWVRSDSIAFVVLGRKTD
jgi:hypothetical protein